MTLASGVPSLIDAAQALRHLEVESFLPTGDASHRVFGAGFLFLGVLLVVESLAGSVWHRSRLRTLIWPAALFSLGLGLIVVTYVDPNQKPVHLALALLLLIGGVLEARHRLRRLPRSTADLFVVPAFILGGILIGPVHAAGELDTVWGQRHMLFGVTGLMLAGVRVRQSMRPASLPLGAAFGAAVVVLALELLASSHAH